MNKMNITDLINIAGTDNICKQQMKRKPDIEKAYLYNKMEPLIFKTNFIIKLNDFPYNVEDNIIHYVLWLNDIYPNNIIQDIINQEFKGYQSVIWWVNAENIRSIKNIYHAHVFVK